MRVIEGGRRRRPRRRIRGKVILIIIAVLLLILAGLYLYLVNAYRVTNVKVEGNLHYTEDEIKDMVMTGRYGNNSLYLSLKYRNKGVEDIPFIETMDVTILSPDSIRITVYEKALAGCIQYLGLYMYFDKDGTVVETSSETTPGVPIVTGLAYNEVILNRKLPIEDEEVFNTILNLTKMMEKYHLQADKIQFSSGTQVTLYFGNVRAKLGKAENLDEKLMNLQYVLPTLEGQSGEIRLENYSDTTQDITFEKDS